MTQLRLAYSNPKIVNSATHSHKLRMSRVNSLKLPPLLSKILLLQMSDPKLVVVIEKLVDDALKKRAG